MHSRQLRKPLIADHHKPCSDIACMQAECEQRALLGSAGSCSMRMIMSTHSRSSTKQARPIASGCVRICPGDPSSHASSRCDNSCAAAADVAGADAQALRPVAVLATCRGPRHCSPGKRCPATQDLILLATRQCSATIHQVAGQLVIDMEVQAMAHPT